MPEMMESESWHTLYERLLNSTKVLVLKERHLKDKHEEKKISFEFPVIEDLKNSLLFNYACSWSDTGYQYHILFLELNGGFPLS